VLCFFVPSLLPFYLATPQPGSVALTIMPDAFAVAHLYKGPNRCYAWFSFLLR
jgi:hypothetical protein